MPLIIKEVTSTEYADEKFKRIVKDIIDHGSLDENPRPVYSDGIPAHTYSINGVVQKFKLSEGVLPLLSIRPIAYKSAIKEILWIYQDQTSDLNVLRDKYGVTWWDEWAVDENKSTIGTCYGETVRRHEILNNLLENIKKDPDSRRHIIDLWQYDDFKEPHGLKPCAMFSQYIVRHDKMTNKDYLDGILMLRSSDYITAGAINQLQYAVLLCLIARHTGYEPGELTVIMNNCQIYDRHLAAAKLLINRHSIPANPVIKLNPDKTNFFDFTPEDITIEGYPLDEIKKNNPQVKLDLGI